MEHFRGLEDNAGGYEELSFVMGGGCVDWMVGGKHIKHRLWINIYIYTYQNNPPSIKLCLMIIDI